MILSHVDMLVAYSWEYSWTLLNGHPQGNGLWPLKRGWPLNIGRNNRKAITGTHNTCYSWVCLMGPGCYRLTIVDIIHLKCTHKKFVMWSIYEIIHIWTVVVDENEEWSSQ